MGDIPRLAIRSAIERTKGATSVYVKELGFRQPEYYDTIDDQEGGFDIYFEDAGYDLTVGVNPDGTEFATVRKGNGPVKFFDGKSVLYCIPVK